MGNTRDEDTIDKIQGTAENFETGALGEDPRFLKKSELSSAEVDAALDLKQISIRLQTGLIEDFKLIGKYHGIGYQTLMRQVLKRFAEAEKRRLLNESMAAAYRATAEEDVMAGLREVEEDKKAFA